MKLLTALLLAILFTTCHSVPAYADTPATGKDFFHGTQGCFLLYNLKSGQFEKVVGGPQCRRRLTACSTFKLPLALMALDAGVIQDENTTLKWDGVKRFNQAWNQDQTAATWIRNSVVWYSQWLTPRLGLKRIKSYLKTFHYGNEDFSDGLQQSWLTIGSGDPSEPTGSLKISAYEQVELMKNYWNEAFPLSKHAYEVTRKITYLETSGKGFELSGKTGSGFFGPHHDLRIGWFVSHVGGNDRNYIAVTSFTDRTPLKDPGYAGFQAREITKSILADLGLW
jgi:beta-lactamase class D